MKVKDLISFLKSFPEDCEVMVSTGTYVDEKPISKITLHTEKRILVLMSSDHVVIPSVPPTPAV